VSGEVCNYGGKLLTHKIGQDLYQKSSESANVVTCLNSPSKDATEEISGRVMPEDSLITQSATLT